MLSGRRLDLLDPSPLDIEIEDIAHGLARVARWNGQTKGDHAFSVAQHCVLVAQLFEHYNQDSTHADRLAALLHDAPEYVVGDMISPFKAALGVDYKAFENRLLQSIHVRFGLPVSPNESISATIKLADKTAAYLEATELAGFSIGEARKYFGQPKGLNGFSAELTPLAPPEAANRYLAAFAELFMIVVCSLSAAPEQVYLHKPSALISILSPPAEFPSFDAPSGANHLKLTFHDVAMLTPGLSAPGEHDMTRLLQFLRRWDQTAPLLVHCWAGVSRSTAAAYIGLCLLKPKGDETELAALLREASPSATPNPMLIQLADTALGRNGRMVRAIQKIGRGVDSFEGQAFALRL
jgi:uncharacterized protein